MAPGQRGGDCEVVVVPIDPFDAQSQAYCCRPQNVVRDSLDEHECKSQNGRFWVPHIDGDTGQYTEGKCLMILSTEWEDVTMESFDEKSCYQNHLKSVWVPGSEAGVKTKENGRCMELVDSDPYDHNKFACVKNKDTYFGEVEANGTDSKFYCAGDGDFTIGQYCCNARGDYHGYAENEPEGVTPVDNDYDDHYDNHYDDHYDNHYDDHYDHMPDQQPKTDPMWSTKEPAPPVFRLSGKQMPKSTWYTPRDREFQDAICDENSGQVEKKIDVETLKST